MRIFITAALAATALLPAAAMAHPDVRTTRTVWIDHHPGAQPVAWQGATHRTRAVVNGRIVTGMKLSPAAYQRNDAIARPARYNLARAGSNQRWVRVHDDAVLVNLRTGRVVTVVYNILR